MRVIAGTARRMKLVTPEGMDTRPTQDIIKETLFNMIQFEVPGCVFVDLCAGSGQMGIEALSRGARRAYFIENDEFQRKISNGEYRNFMQEGALDFGLISFDQIEQIIRGRMNQSASIICHDVGQKIMALANQFPQE